VDKSTQAGWSDDYSLFSLQPVTRWISFTMSALRRHWMSGLVVFVASTTFGGMLLAGAPPSYQTAATILLSGDNGLGGTQGITTTASRQASAVILRQDSLDRIVSELQLVDEQPERPPFGRLRHRIGTTLFGEGTRRDQEVSMRDELRRSVIVTSNDTRATIDIQITWPDPDQAVAIAETAYQVFLDERTRVEIEPIQESVEILGSRAARATTSVNALRDQLDLSPGDGAPAGSVLEGAVRTEQDLVGMLRVAELDLDQAKAGIPLRYALLAEPERPRVPLSGNLLNYVAAMTFGVAVASAAAFWIDRPRGRIIAPWQLERFDIPVIAVSMDGPRT
jgi:uncharacterized protein involved in exopolysaccharide biosynthesis